MAVWSRRYFRAYLHAHDKPFNDAGRQKGHSKPLALNGAAMPGSALGIHDGKNARNKAVQDYLKRRGGILEIGVHDIPSINKPDNRNAENVERVLIFDCGVERMARRASGWRRIRIDSAKPEREWVYNFQIGGAAPGIKITGLKLTNDPTPRGDGLPDGGIW